MNHYVYQITNNINNKIYIGKRSCKCDIKDDTYFGSGYALKKAIKKYGKQNFSKTIIDICDDVEMAYELEALIVDADFIKRPDVYNLCGGGTGVGVSESSPWFGKHHSEETKTKISAAIIGKTLSDETRTKISVNNVGFKGKRHSDETKAKMSINHADMKGENNPRFGKKLSHETVAKIQATKLANKLERLNNFRIM
jgi:group I intron endonuclease